MYSLKTMYALKETCTIEKLFLYFTFETHRYLYIYLSNLSIYSIYLSENKDLASTKTVYNSNKSYEDSWSNRDKPLKSPNKAEAGHAM